MSARYRVQLTHPNDPVGRWSGAHVFTVSQSGDADAPRYYAKAPNFGCGRDALTPELAIRQLAAESAATVTAIVGENEADADAPAYVVAYRYSATGEAQGFLTMDADHDATWTPELGSAWRIPTHELAASWARDFNEYWQRQDTTRRAYVIHQTELATGQLAAPKEL